MVRDVLLLPCCQRQVNHSVDRKMPFLTAQPRGNVVSAHEEEQAQRCCVHTRLERFALTAMKEVVQRHTAERLNRILPVGSMLMTFTSSCSPSLSSSRTSLTRCVAISDTCSSPSVPGMISTKAPKSVMRCTLPMYVLL